MINIIIFSCVCLTAALFLMGFICYNVLKIMTQVNELNQKLTQMDLDMQAFEKNFASMEAKMLEQFEAQKAIQKAPVSSVGFVGKELIEQNYERAKTLLKRGMPLDRELMASCSMTEEEFELLSELHDA